jgi:hypothetical protein
VQFLSLRLDPLAQPVAAWVREQVAAHRAGELAAVAVAPGHDHDHGHIHHQRHDV